MSGMFLGRTALALLIPAVIFFGLFMFGTGFLSGSFYRARTTPVETVVRRGGGETLSRLQAQNQAPAPSPEQEAESLAQSTGQLESPPPGQDGQPQQERTAPLETAQSPQEPEPGDSEAGDSARDRALAELRASQQQPQTAEEATPEATPEAEPETPPQPETQPATQAGADTEAQPPQSLQSEDTAAPTAADKQPYTFQVGAFLVQTNAAELAATLMSRGYESWVVSEKDNEGRLWHFVRVGRYQDREEATSAAAAFKQREGVNAVPVPLATGNGTPPNNAASPPAQPLYVVHAGAYSNAQAARNAARPLLDQGYVPCVATFQDEEHQTWHLVEVVEFPSRAEALAFMKQSAERGTGPELKLRMLDARDISGKHCF